MAKPRKPVPVVIADRMKVSAQQDVVCFEADYLGQPYTVLLNIGAAKSLHVWLAGFIAWAEAQRD